MGASSSRLPSTQRESRTHKARASSLSVLRWPFQSNGRDQKTLGTGGHKLAMEHETKTARFLDRIDDEAFGDPLLHLEDELIGCHLARGWGAA
jgi:hypothetical protein